MILRQRLPGGINRDVDLGPSSGIRWGAPIGGRMIEAAPPVRKNRTTPERQEYQRAYQQERRDRSKTTVCGLPMVRLAETCARRAGHRHDCKSRYALDNQLVMRARRESVDAGRKR